MAFKDGQGNTLRCPRICGDVACEGCTCTTPCPEAIDAPVWIERYPARANNVFCIICKSEVPCICELGGEAA